MQRLARPLAPVCVVCALVMPACTGHEDPGDPGLLVGEERATSDEASLVRIALERALVDRMIPDHSLLVSAQPIVLSSENIEAGWVPELDGVSLVLRTAEEIQARADGEGDFLYLRFGTLRVEGDEASLTLENRWAVAADSPHVYLSGGGFRMEFRRTPFGWTGEITVAWIS